MKDNDNVYFLARKKAATYNERLYSREGAAELLGVSVSTLADYELGNTKVVPVDKVVLMADLYNCKNECPIGKSMPMATQAKNLEGIALRLIREFDADKLKNIQKDLIEITEDGVIDDTEKPALKSIMERLDQMAIAISELKIAGEKALKG